MTNDWLFRSEDYRCDLRVAGVLLKDGKILLQRDKNGAEYALPGGHVQVGEETKNALKREFCEEMGISVEVQRLLWTEECFWNWQGQTVHSLCFYYLVSGEAEALEGFRPHRDNEQVEYGFVPLELLAGLTVYPEFLKERIGALSDHPEHFVTYA